MLVLHEQVAALNVLHYILSHNYDYRSILLVIFSKACTVIMQKKNSDMRYEHVHSNSNKSVYNSRKVVNCKYDKSQSFVSIFLKIVSKLSDYAISRLCSFFSNFPCRALMHCCTLST